MALQGVSDACHAVVRSEVIELWEYLPFPVDAVAHPARHSLTSVCLVIALLLAHLPLAGTVDRSGPPLFY